MSGTMFLVEGGMGRMAVRAETLRRALAYVRREFGRHCEPYKALRATNEQLREHLHYGGMFFDADGSTIPKAEAFALCSFQAPAPSKPRRRYSRQEPTP